MLYVEEMQSQQRAENGIEEIVIGYADQDEFEPEDLDANDLGIFDSMGTYSEVALHDLPPDIRDILLAENHRMRTGEVIGVQQYKEREGM